MLKDKLFQAGHSIIDILQAEESDSIHRAADLIATAVSQSKTVFLYDRGHLLGGELLCRAGGPVFMRRLDYFLPDPAMRNSNTGQREKRLQAFQGPEKEQAIMAYEDIHTDYMMQCNNLGIGDVLIINSVSGKGHPATSIARAAKKYGVSLIIISSLIAAQSIEPEGGGQRLIDYANVFINNHVPFGDAMFELEGVDQKVCPASGLSAAFIGWAMVLESIELTLAKGVSPTIFRSNNIPDGPEQLTASFARYQELGY